MAKKKNTNTDYDKYFFDSKARNKKSKKRGNNRKKWLIIWGTVLVISAAYFIFIISGLPSLEQLENPKPQLASKVYTADGELLGTISIQNRIETKLDSLPSYLPKALISTEDRKFYTHWGVDLTRFIKAMVKNVLTFSHEGASTITQQLAKNLYHFKVRDENIFQTVTRKIREWITAVQIEKTFTKKEILQMYLNVSYFGRGAYGIESAARVYFGKKGKDLTLPECAMFVAMLKSPVYYDPVKHPAHALERRNLVMYNMVTNDMLPKDEYEKLKTEPIDLASDKLNGNQTIAPYFMEYVRQQMIAYADQYGFDLYRDGLNIYTSINYKMQQIANKVITDHLKEYQAGFNKRWNWKKHEALLKNIIDRAIRDSRLYNLAHTKEAKAKVYNDLKYSPAFIDSVKKIATTIQVGFVVIDPTNGQIKAMVGGENQDFGRGLNHAVNIKRQPGSAFKPFTYTVAIDNGYFPAYTVLNQKFNYNGWSPDNFEDEYGGYMTMRQALAYSVNVVAGRLTISNIAPPDQVVKYAHRMGIESPLDPYPSIALGTSGVSPLELTSAYGTFADSGIHVSPISILKIEDKNGILIHKFVPSYTEAISPQTASIMVSMLEDVVNYGTGAGIRKYFQYPAAGKTGTTQNYSDAWYVGFTPQLVAGAWVGFDDHRIKFTNSYYGQGAHAAAPIWGKFMEGAYKELNIPVKYFQLATGVDTVEFCKTTMNMGDTKLATPNCPDVVKDIINMKNLPPKCEIHNGGSNNIKKEEKKGDSGW